VREGGGLLCAARRAEWAGGIPRLDPQRGPGRFRFLNQEHTVASWNDSHLPKLWLYNLHYFDYPTLELMERWLAENPPGTGNGWEPYPLSLRTVNWMKHALGGAALPVAVLESLAVQVRYLAQSVEYHLLANHLFVNGKALVFAGAFFEGPEAAGWLRMGLEILAREVPEQVLADGGHFERSPMYHALILEDLLDLIELGRVYGSIPEAVETRWREAAGRMLGWLRRMLHPDGEIAFFNDAAFGVAPAAAELFSYAGRLGVTERAVRLRESGYYRLENERAVVLIDAGPIGPDYQPGHAHADTLSFELSVDGRRVVVNSGTSTYENNALRHWQRSTAAHNTVAIDGENQSEMWSAFRVARRAYPSGVRSDDATYVEASHDGYRRLADPVIHRRRFGLGAEALTITDEVMGRGAHEVELFFHFHPDAEAEVELDPALRGSLEESCWYPEFSVSVPNRTVRGWWRGSCPVRFTTRVVF